MKFDPDLYYCKDCHDETSGWRQCHCPGVGHEHNSSMPTLASHLGMEQANCGRDQPHYAHYFAVRCHCRGANPVVAERLAKFAAKRGKKPDAV